jgi:uncharacterized membrane protein
VIVEGANQLRLIAAEIIRKLWQAGEITQLELLEQQAKSSIEHIKKNSSQERQS